MSCARYNSCKPCFYVFPHQQPCVAQNNWVQFIDTAAASGHETEKSKNPLPSSKMEARLTKRMSMHIRKDEKKSSWSLLKNRWPLASFSNLQVRRKGNFNEILMRSQAACSFFNPMLGPRSTLETATTSLKTNIIK